MNDAASTTPPTSSEDDQGLSNASVMAKTGKTWPEWFAILDSAGAEQMDHRHIVAYLSRAHVVSPWWQQMVTVTYEQERARRLRHAAMDDFQISATTKVEAGVSEAISAWSDDGRRSRWLEIDARVRRVEPGKWVILELDRDHTKAEVLFEALVGSGCQVSVRHKGLADAETAEQMRVTWAEALARLRGYLAP